MFRYILTQNEFTWPKVQDHHVCNRICRGLHLQYKYSQGGEFTTRVFCIFNHERSNVPHLLLITHSLNILDSRMIQLFGIHFKVGIDSNDSFVIQMRISLLV